MPIYIPYPDRPSAEARSATWAAHLGCGQHPEDVTRQWYGVRTPTGDPEADAGLPLGAVAVVVVPDLATPGARTSELIRADQMTAEELAALVALYPPYAVGVAYTAGELIAYAGTLYEIVQGHTSQADWPPDALPALYTPKAPAGVIPEWVQPTGASDSYALGAKVTFNGQVWQSTQADNVWQPGVYGWAVDS